MSELKFKKKKGWMKTIIGLLGIGFLIFGITLGPSGFLLVFLTIFIYQLVAKYLEETNTKKFYKLQRDLPTANTRSVAMGLAEISGKTEAISLIISKLEKKECIGYLYTIEGVTQSRDSDGRTSYRHTLEFSEIICNPFFIKDKVGIIRVLPEEIEFIDFEIDQQYSSSGKRYTQYLLKEKMEVLLIGKAGLTTNNKTVFQKENIKDIFGIAPIEKVNTHNNLQPLIRTATYYVCFWLVLIAYILVTPMQLKNNTIEFGEINLKMTFQNSEQIKSIEDFIKQKVNGDVDNQDTLDPENKN